MANRLRSSSAKVSFFAFLDMITTVTGVLLLITLLLTLYLKDPQASPAESARDSVRDQLEQARAKLEANLKDLRQRQLQAAALTNRIFVVPEIDRSGKQPVLVVLSATNGWCTRLGQTNSVEFLARFDNADFRRMLDSWDPAKQRLVFYIRPSAIGHFTACRQLAASRAFSIGFDAAQEDRQYVLATP
ncbi:MAG TPA: hypothetical protein VFC44_20560 [Candidatus Saccharimonadales bacterium]|nr:hypothetical protein [Candidatus Saccharimonadales bacterium]